MGDLILVVFLPSPVKQEGTRGAGFLETEEAGGLASPLLKGQGSCPIAAPSDAARGQNPSSPGPDYSPCPGPA